jgi:hypothetical protein
MLNYQRVNSLYLLVIEHPSTVDKGVQLLRLFNGGASLRKWVPVERPKVFKPTRASTT